MIKKYLVNNFLILLAATIFSGIIFVSSIFAQPVVTDLGNLKNASSTLVAAYTKIDIFNAWDTIFNKQSLFSTTTIAIIDTGIDASGDRHPEFTGINFGKSSPFALNDHAVEFKSSLTFGHGTEVAGIIGANNLSEKTILSSNNAQMNGIISAVTKKYVLESRSALLLGLLTTPGFGNIIDNLTSGAIVNISMQVGTKPEDFSSDKDYLRQVFVKNSDKIFIIAAGNDDDNASKFIPSNINLDNTIIVGATDLSDKRANWLDQFGHLLGKSNFGSGVNVSAPGIEVYAPAIRGKGNFPTSGSEAFNYITNFSGTSASAPMVTGVAGLIKAIKPGLSPKDIKDILVRTADPIQTDQPIGGRLNALKAVCDPQVLNCPPPVSQAPVWPMLQKNAQRTGLSDVSGSPFATSTQVTVKWQKDLNIATNFSPLVGSQTVYVGTGLQLKAFDKISGNQIWQTDISAGIVNGAIGPDGTIYVCGINANQQSTLTAVNPQNGQIKWQFAVGLFRSCNSPAVGQNGIIYTTIPPPLNTQTAVVVAVNPDGSQKWRHEEGNISTTPPALSNDESQVYVGFFNDLKSFDVQTGQVLWTRNVPSFPFLVVVDPNDRVMAQTLNGPITAFSKSGAFLWQNGSASAFSLYLQNKILTANPFSFAIRNTSDGSFISGGFWPNGFQLIGNTFPIVDKDGLFYLPIAIFGSTPIRVWMFAFDSLGSPRWSFDIPSTLDIAAIGSSALDNDGSLYLVAQGLLLKFGR